MEKTVIISPVQPGDVLEWLAMRSQLWPEDTEEDHKGEVDQFFAGEFPYGPTEVLIARDPEGRVAGFAEVSVRLYAEGCTNAGVGYLEGWYVVPEFRRTGVGGSLVRAAEEWARKQGMTEFASDTDPGNEESIAAHHALGFQDAGLVKCFIKNL